jgi:hypothetical protein
MASWRDPAARRIVHVAPAGEFHLDGMDAVGGAAIVPRGPAALEAAVDDVVERGRGGDAGDRFRQGGIAGASVDVPMLNCGSVPSNRRGTTERIACAS